MNLTDRILQIAVEAHTQAALAGLPPPTLAQLQVVVADTLARAPEEELGHKPRPPLHDTGE